MRIPVVLDTDLAMGAPGSDVDDGFALAMALADRGVDLRLITTVNGNTDVDTATVLSRDLLERLGRSALRVQCGADRPLRRGASSNPAVDAMITEVLARPGEITLVAIGPLTNVALAVRAEPRFATALGSLVIMGGVFAGGPSRPALSGEFNASTDPEAVQIVLDAAPVGRWVGLDVTRRVRLSRSEAVEMSESTQPFEAFAGDYSVGWIDHLAAQGGDPESCALHDPLAVAVVTRPDLVTFEPVRLSVGLGEHERGVMTVARSAVPNAEIGVDVDVDGFRSRFRTLLAAAASTRG